MKQNKDGYKAFLNLTEGSNQQPKDASKDSSFTGGEWFVNWSGHPDNGRIQIGTGKDYIAEMYGNNWQEGDENFISEEEIKANAALISQAPAMYNALKDLIAGNDFGMGKKAMQLRFDIAKEILLKANPNLQTI